MVDVGDVAVFADEVLEQSDDVADDDHRGRHRRFVKVLVDEAVAVEAPHLLRVLLHLLKSVTAIMT
jgi:hypothetical protein